MADHLILDLNATCEACHYPIPPHEMIVVSPGKLKCPKCHSVFSAQKGKKPTQSV
jgi:Zn finger protein HypA/HybF involved in hydrogenase expression